MKISMQELLIVLAIVVIIFGPTQIPKLKRMFRKSKKELQDSLADSDDEAQEWLLSTDRSKLTRTPHPEQRGVLE